MNEVFSFRRWVLLTGLHWYENKKKYLLSFLTLAILGFTVDLLVIFTGGRFDPGEQGAIYFAGIFLSGCIFASTLFADLAIKARGIMYLSRPASLFEKLLTALFYAIIAFPIIYTFIFYALNIPAVKISNEMRYKAWKTEKVNRIINHDTTTMYSFIAAPAVNIFRAEQYHYPNVKDAKEGFEPEETNYYIYLWEAFLTFEAFFALGSIWFGRFSFIKTCVFAFSIFLVFLLLNLLLRNIFGHSGYNYLRDYDDVKNITLVYEIPAWVVSTESILLQVFFTPLFWVLAYLKLKEKQI
jgi:hypothetical protein